MSSPVRQWLEGLGLAQYGDRFEAELRGAPPSPVASDRMAATPTPAKHLPDKILHSKSALEVERKQVTVLFADMKGSMELAEQMYPEAWSAIMQPFFTILAEGVERFEGFVDKFTTASWRSSAGRSRPRITRSAPATRRSTCAIAFASMPTSCGSIRASTSPSALASTRAR